MSVEEVREEIASRIIVDCGEDSEYPCPHAHPALGYSLCPHEDKDICIWQIEQADGILSIKVNSKTIREIIEEYEK